MLISTCPQYSLDQTLSAVESAGDNAVGPLQTCRYNVHNAESLPEPATSGSELGFATQESEPGKMQHKIDKAGYVHIDCSVLPVQHSPTELDIDVVVTAGSDWGHSPRQALLNPVAVLDTEVLPVTDKEK